MVQMNQFAEQKLRHRSREKNVWTPQGGKSSGGGGWGWWCAELGNWD